MLVGSAVTIAALVVVVTGVLAFGQPSPSGSPGSSGVGASGATSSSPGGTASSTATLLPTAPTSTTPATQPAGVTFLDGVHNVGEDIPPGTYRIRQPAATYCAFQRLRGMGGTSEDYIIDDTVSGYAVVTIKATDLAFKSSDCGEWSSDLSMVTSSKREIPGDGIYIVGTDIMPGTWRSTGGEDCYWARLSGFTRNPEELVANDIVNAATTVIVRPDDVGFETVRCGAWHLK